MAAEEWLREDDSEYLIIYRMVKGKLVGAVWVQIMNDYGIDDDTPSLAMSVLSE